MHPLEHVSSPLRANGRSSIGAPRSIDIQESEFGMDKTGSAWASILMPHGWNLVHVRDDGTQMWRRPGKVTGISAVASLDSFVNFSTAAGIPANVEITEGELREYVKSERMAETPLWPQIQTTNLVATELWSRDHSERWAAIEYVIPDPVDDPEPHAQVLRPIIGWGSAAFRDPSPDENPRYSSEPRPVVLADGKPRFATETIDPPNVYTYRVLWVPRRTWRRLAGANTGVPRRGLDPGISAQLRGGRIPVEG